MQSSSLNLVQLSVRSALLLLHYGECEHLYLYVCVVGVAEVTRHLNNYQLIWLEEKRNCCFARSRESRDNFSSYQKIEVE